MITANRWFKMNWGTYQSSVLLPELAMRFISWQGLEEGKPMIAFMNHGRWLIRCECGGAEYAWEEGYFMCRSCFNAAHGHKVRKSVFPRERQDIEKMMLSRPLPNRNWEGETILTLKEENVEHKAELLELKTAEQRIAEIKAELERLGGE